MASEMRKETEHYGYRYEFVEIIGKKIFAVYNITCKNKRLVSGFENENDAKRECRYLEKLNFGGYEPWKARNG